MWATNKEIIKMSKISVNKKLKGSALIIASMLLTLLMTGCHKHVYAPATCTLPPTCTECGKTEGEALGHIFGAATCEEPSTCSRCGQTQGDPNGHKWEDATCEEASYCSVCGKTEGVALGHDSTEATCTEPAVCKICGKQTAEKIAHKYSEGNCTTDSVCEKCGDIKKAPGHTFAEATCDKPKTCKVCNETEGDPLGHNLVNGVCSKCGMEFGSLELLKNIVNLKASCETDYKYCVVNADCDPSEGNPYDVEYDYGEVYDSFVEACDWSLIYDDSYYISNYPILAKLYHNDKNLLLKHFQTVGIHEGRQGNSSFNVAAYKDNCENIVAETFGDDYAAYAIYYMLNYDSEKNVEHKKLSNGNTPARQQKVVLTIMQNKELIEINNYRAEVGAQDLKIDAELCAFANYRAWMNAHDDWAGHDWAKQNEDKVWELLNTMKAISMAENTVTTHTWQYSGAARYESYYNSKEHYEALIKTKYNFFGTSHFYNSKNENLNNDKWKGKEVASTFDCFTDNAKTAYNN